MEVKKRMYSVGAEDGTREIPFTRRNEHLIRRVEVPGTGSLCNRLLWTARDGAGPLSEIRS